MAHERESACQWLEEAAEHFRDLDDAWGVAVATSYHGSALAIEPGFEEEARRLLTEGRARGEALEDDWVVTLSSHYLGSIALRQGDYGLARKLTEEMLASAREMGDAFRVSRNLHQLSEIAMAQKQFDEARRQLRASITLSREQGRMGDVAVHLRSLARIDAEQSQHERAAQSYGAASRLDGVGTTIPTDDPEIDRRVQQALRATLGQRTYEAEWVAGASLPLERAITLALISPHTWIVLAARHSSTTGTTMSMSRAGLCLRVAEPGRWTGLPWMRLLSLARTLYRQSSGAGLSAL